MKYPGLNKQYNSKIRQEYLDYDYIDQLSEKEKEWLNSFTEEYIAANFNHPGKTFHKTKKSKREIYNQNNARNRCLMSQSRAQNKLDNYTQSVEESIEEKNLSNTRDIEDSMIDYLDKKKKFNE